jgi:hypothetical protein
MSEVKILAVEANGSRDLWAWWYDPQTRRNSRTTGPVPLADHEFRLAASLKNPARVILLVETDGVKCGVVRFDSVDQTKVSWQVGITMNPGFSGKRVGARGARGRLQRNGGALRAVRVRCSDPVRKRRLAADFSTLWIHYRFRERRLCADAPDAA